MSHDPVGPGPIDREDVDSLLAVRQELGDAMEPALVDSFAEKILAEVRRQTHANAAEKKDRERLQAADKSSSGAHLALAITSLVLAIPLTAIALGLGSSWMAVVAWIGIVLVNFTYSIGRRKQS